MRILLVGINSKTKLDLVKALSKQGHSTLPVEVDELFSLSDLNTFNLIILQPQSPAHNGSYECRRLRDDGFCGVLILVSPVRVLQDLVCAIDAGADDYFAIPIDMAELIAKIRCLFRRSDEYKHLLVGVLTVDLRNHAVLYRGVPVFLSNTEYRLLVTLMRYPGTVFSAHDLADRIWSQSEIQPVSTIKSHVRFIRRKLIACGCEDEIIETVFGFGYRLGSISKD